MSSPTFVKGQVVVHSGKPEWGPGDVLSAESATQDGAPCQRVTIRFARAGLKTLSTAFAELKPAPKETEPPISPADATPGETDRDLSERLVALPEEATDPFLGAEKRLGATLGLYRFADGPSGLLDWATVQTGMRDPLGRFTRHELESHFARFRIALDTHLKNLLRDLRRKDPAMVDRLLAQAGVAARSAVRRVDVVR